MKEELVIQDRLEVLYDSFKAAIPSFYLGPAVLFGYIYFAETDYHGTLTWLLLMFIVNTSVVVLRMIRNRSEKPGDKKWLTVAAAMSFGYGTAFGALPYFIGSDDPIVHMVILTVTAFYIVGGPLLYGVAYKVSPFYYIPIGLLPAIHAINMGNSSLQLIGYIYLLWIPTSIMATKAFDKVMSRSILLSRSNEELAERLKTEKQEAEYANLSKSRFLAAASHDLRQPLHALGLFANQLGKNTKQSEQQNLNREIKVSVKVLSTMLDALLDVSRIDSNELRISRQDFCLGDLMQTIRSEYSSLAESKDIELKVHSSNKICVNSDPAQLDRMIRNLVSNAIRYTDNGKVVVGVRWRPEQYEVQVWDTGIGMEKHQLGNIFEEFYQVDNPERDREKGVGLGLSIVNRLSTLLEHPIKVSSESGKGSCFSILLPKSDKPVNKYTVQELNESLLAGMIVLVIDDDTAVLRGMRRLLENWQGTVFTAQSGEEAILILEQEGVLPDVVISDYRLRENERGDDVLVRLNEYMGTRLNSILMTGDLEFSISSNLRIADLRIIHKPVDADQLNYELARMLYSL